MLFRKRKREVPGLNTSSTADISFMLLILFLVTTSIDSNKGIDRKLPAIDRKKQAELPETAVNAKHLVQFEVKKDGIVLLNKQPIGIAAVKERVQQFITVSGKQHYIQLKADRDASYKTYFQVQNALVAAYLAVKDKASLATFGKIYELCSPEQQEVIDGQVPERVSEIYVLSGNENSKEGGV